jgi:cytochrome c556
MKLSRIAGAAALLIAAWGVQAKVRVPASPPAPSAQDIVNARQAAMVMSASALGTVRGIAARPDSVKGAAFPANGLAKWAAALPAMFPASTRNIAGTRAKPEIWTNRTDFNARAEAFASATTALLDAAKADDHAAFTAAVESTAAACKACHDSYQAPPPPKPAG